MTFSEPQIESLAPKPAAYKAAQKLVDSGKVISSGQSERAMWGSIQGSGKKPYNTQIDIQQLAYKCSCPSRQFPCKHALTILLLNAKGSVATGEEEPAWVIEWIDKRRAKATAPAKEVKELTAEDLALREKQKNKRVEDRIILVNAGVQELDKWLQDIVRIGLLELPNRPYEDFQNMAARMVDAKAPGLAGWVRALGSINFAEAKTWQDEALMIIAKLNLLLRSWTNRESLERPWLATIKNLVGWSQSTKDLKTNKEAYAVKDQWLILGIEQETSDDIVVQRQWLWGCSSGESVLVLNFGTRFSPLENAFVAASVIEAEVAYFPSISPHRGIVRMQKSISNLLRLPPAKHDGLDELKQAHHLKLRQNPWASNLCYLLDKVQLIKMENGWSIVDTNQAFMPLVEDKDVVMKWMLYSGNQPVGVAVVMKGKALKVLGIFAQSKYYAL